MKRLPSFRTGGIVPEGPRPRNRHEERNAYLPADAVVPLRQHSGPPARPTVQAGDRVFEGQVIGRADAAGSANVHSPIPGVVTAIHQVRLPGGQSCDAVVIALSGSFERLGRPVRRSAWRNMQRHEMLREVRESGIVRPADGRPLHELLSEASEAGGLDLLVVPAFAPEPFLEVEPYVLGSRRDDVLEGLAVAAALLRPKAVLVVLGEDDAAEAASWDGAAIDEGPAIEAALLPLRFPAHLPRQLADSLRGGKVLAQGERWLALEPSVLLALRDAIVAGAPSLERYLAVGGGAVNAPAILKVRLGTRIGEVFEECGGFRQTPQCIVAGGSLGGRACADLDVPVGKDTVAILALTAEETRQRAERPCIRCGRCAGACPEGLDPSRLHKLLDAGRTEAALSEGLADCSRCGACAYVCPSRVPLSQRFASAPPIALRSPQ